MRILNLESPQKLKKAFIVFMMYSVSGWLYESFLELVIYHEDLSNVGTLYGPYCPIYGIGALIFYLLLYPLIKDKPERTRLFRMPLIFAGCFAIATGVELLASYISEMATGSWAWQSYSDYKINFQGRIALSTSIRFGLGGVVFLYAMQPIFEKIVQKMNSYVLDITFSALASIIITDCIAFFVFS